MKKYIGMFSFRKDPDGNLKGEYLEHSYNESFTENCEKRISF